MDSRQLNLLGRALPEGAWLTNHFPDWFKGSGADLIFTDSATLTAVFVHNGTGGRHTIGYYTYPSDRPPQSLDDIQRATVIFPNAAFSGDGGGLSAGNRVRLGAFSAGTAVGFFIIPGGFNDGVVNDEAATFYSTDALNNEPILKRHLLIINDSESRWQYLCFESEPTGTLGAGRDFNDVVVLLTASPAGALETRGFPALPSALPDRDNDRAPDLIDQWPEDPARAFVWNEPITATHTNNFTIAFENNWPRTGDWDFNDLVIGAHIKRDMNGNGMITSLICNYQVLAVGSSQHDGFGVQLPIAASRIRSVIGGRHTAGYINFAGNGCEAGQSNAVIIPFDDALGVVSPPAGATTVNTEPGSSPVTPTPIEVKVEFTEPVASVELGTAPFNPFLIANRNRAVEIHLPSGVPTQLADPELFGQGEDASNPNIGRYYRTERNLPWGLLFPIQWLHPLEGVEVPEAYPYLPGWAASGGTTAADWFVPAVGYYREDKVWQP